MIGPNTLRITLALALVIAFALPGCDTLVTEVNNTTLVDSTLGQTCLNSCHSDSDNRIVVPRGQWENSAHSSPKLIEARVTLNGKEYLTSDANCGATCHTSEGFIDFVQSGVASSQTTPSPIGCYSCHMPHTGAYAEWSIDSLRGSADLVILDGGFGYDMGKSNMCVICHKAPNGPPTGTDDITLTGTWGPHRSPQAEVLAGVGGFRFGGEVEDVMTHSSVVGRDGCISCHYGDNGIGYDFGEHTFRLEDSLGVQFDENCNVAGCHTGNTEATEIIDFYDFASIQTADSLASLIRDSLWGRNILDTSDISGMSFYADSTLLAYNVPILYNYLLYRGDGSRGVHNPALMEALMTATASRIDSLPPQANFELANPGDTLICDDHGAITLLNTSLSNRSDYFWNTGEGSANIQANDLTWTYNVPGSYDVMLIADGPGGLADTIIKDDFIVVVGQPIAKFGADKVSDCDSFTVNFADQSTFADTWLWDFGDGNTSTEQNPSHKYDSPEATYAVTLIAGGLCGEDTLTIADFISIRPDTALAEASFTMSADSIDIGQSIIFTNTSPRADVWYWDFGDGTTDSTSAASSFSPSHLYDSADTYEIKLTIRYGCNVDSFLDTVKVVDTTASAPR